MLYLCSSFFTYGRLTEWVSEKVESDRGKAILVRTRDTFKMEKQNLLWLINKVSEGNWILSLRIIERKNGKRNTV